MAIDDSVVCWECDSGELVEVPAGAYKAVSVGEFSTCAITVDDTITCWGSDAWGAADAPAGAFKAVSVGANHSCALAIDDSVVCWGDELMFRLLDIPAGTYGAVSDRLDP